MARLKTLPNLEIIRGFRGVIDFAVWKGLPYARSWPRYRPARRSAAAIASALLFGQIVKAYSLLASEALAFYQEDAKDQPRTPRDIMVSGVFGNLHEASMSNFLDLLTECRDSLVNLEALLHALDSVGTDEIDVNVEHSVLPDGAATAAHQVTQTTALQRLDDLQDTLQSVDTDALQVRGRNQLFSFLGTLITRRSATISGANGYIDSNPCLAGQVWAVTAVAAVCVPSATTRVVMGLWRAPNFFEFHDLSIAKAADQWHTTQTRQYLLENDVIRAYLSGAGVGDACHITLTGHNMTLEA